MTAGSPYSALAADSSLEERAPKPRGRSVVRSGPWLVALCCAVFAAVLAVRAYDLWVFTLDDSFITLRYARHLAQGLGPSWNPGAEPAEGYTTVLWMLVLSLAELTRLDGLWFAKSIGLVFALGSLAMAALIARRVSMAAGFAPRAELLATLAVLTLYVSYWPLSLHAVSGMETACSCFVLSLFFFYSVALQTRSSSPYAVARPDTSTQDLPAIYRGLALSALACCLTRPEAVVPVAATLLTQLWLLPRAQRASLVRAATLFCALPFLVYYLWRWQHFGLLFPLSFYVKASGQSLFSGQSVFKGLPDVLEFFGPWVTEQPWWGALLLVGATRMRPLLPSVVGATALAAFFVFPEHIMAFEGRYLLPLFPLLAALAGVGVARAFERSSRWVRGARAQHLLLGFALLALLGLAFSPLPGDRRARAQRWLDYGKSLRAAHVALAHDLAGAQGQGGRIALLDVGAIGYYADWYTIDTFGLNDSHVALTRRSDVSYVLAKKPDLLVVVSARPERYQEVFAWETPLYEAARRARYQTLCNYEFARDYYLQVLVRSDPAAIRGAVCSSASHRIID